MAKSTAEGNSKKPALTDGNTWRDRYGIATRTQTQMFDRFAGWYNLMYAHINTSSYALWRSKVFLPIVPQKAWDMIAKLQSLQPGFEVGLFGDALNDENAQDRAEKAQWELEHNWSNPRFDEPMSDKLFSPLVDAVVTGSGFAKIPWKTCNNIRYEKHIDEETGEIDLTKDDKIEKFEGYNELEPIDVMSFFVTPGAKSVQKAPWIMIEDWPTLDDLKAENKEAGTIIYKNLDKVESLKATSDEFYQYKRARDQISNNEDPLSADSTLRHFKRVECYEKSTNYFYTYAVGSGSDGSTDSWIELNVRPNPFWHGKYPIVGIYTKRRPHSIWGQGIFEDTERMQAAFNDIFNHYMDNLNLSLDGMIMKEEGEEYNYIVQPGGEFLYKNKPPAQFKFPTPDANSFETVMNMIEAQVENSTIPPYASGNTNSNTDNTQGTATGILALQMAAGDKLGFMRQNYATAVRQVGSFWLSNNQQFIGEDLTIQGSIDGQPKPVTITPMDRQGQFVLRINDASMDPPNQEQVLSEFQAYVTQLQAMQQASIEQASLTKWATPPIFINFASLVQDLSQKFRQANFDKVLMDSDKIISTLGNMGPQAWITPSERVQIGIDDLFGSEAAQLLQRNGITADPQRAGTTPTTTSVTNPVTGNQSTTAMTPAAQTELSAGQPVAFPATQSNNSASGSTAAAVDSVAQPPNDPAATQVISQTQQQQAMPATPAANPVLQELAAGQQRPGQAPEYPWLPGVPHNPVDQQVARDAMRLHTAGHLNHMTKGKKNGRKRSKTETPVG